VKVLITGGCGFIGSEVLRVALEHGHEVVNLDKLTYAGNTANVAELMGDPRYSFIHGDIADPGIARQAVQGCEVVINLAAESHVDRSLHNPTEFIEVSIRELYTTIAEAVALVVLVVMIFLQSWRATLIPVVAIPVSLIGTCAVMLALGYSTQRGYGNNHPFVGEIRYGHVPVSFVPEELGFAIEIGEIEVTECDMVNQFAGSHDVPPQFTRGYGLAFGHAERKAMAMALVDRALRADELGEAATSPAQDEEFVLAHSDNVERSGFVQHLKLPHYVDFQSELVVVRMLRTEAEQRREQAALAQAAE